MVAVQCTFTHLRCIPFGCSGSGSVIQVHSDHRTSKEPINSTLERTDRSFWCTMIQEISDHWSWSGLSQRNALLVNFKLPPRGLWTAVAVSLHTYAIQVLQFHQLLSYWLWTMLAVHLTLFSHFLLLKLIYYHDLNNLFKRLIILKVSILILLEFTAIRLNLF